MLEIFHYIAFRAKHEEVPFKLESTFFTRSLARGVRLFFGVLTDSEGVVVRDTRSPDTLVVFRNTTLPKDVWCIVLRYKKSIEQWEQREALLCEHLEACVPVEPVDYAERVRLDPVLWKPQNLEKIAALEEGDNVKIQVLTERFWVQIVYVHDGRFIAIVNNVLFLPGLNLLDTVTFEARHIMRIKGGVPPLRV